MPKVSLSSDPGMRAYQILKVFLNSAAVGDEPEDRSVKCYWGDKQLCHEDTGCSYGCNKVPWYLQIPTFLFSESILREIRCTLSALIERQSGWDGKTCDLCPALVPNLL